MAIAPLIVGIRTQGAAALSAAGAAFRRLGNNIRQASNRAQNSFIARGGLTGALGRATRQVQAFGRAAVQQARQFTSAIQQVIQGGFSGLPAEVKAAVIGAGVVIGGMLATAIGASLNAVLLAGLGGGIIAAGIAIAAKASDPVQAAFRKVFEPIGKDVRGFAMDAFGGPLIEAAAKFEAAWSRSGQRVRALFAGLGPSVGPLVDGLIGMAEKALPGIEKAAKAAEPVLKELGDDLPELGRAISSMFDSFADGSDGAVKGIRVLVFTIGTTLVALGNTVEFLSKQWDRMSDSAERFTRLGAKIPVLGKLIEPFADLWGRLNGSVQGSARAMEGAGLAAEGSSLHVYDLAKSAETAARAAQKLSEQLHGLVSDQLSAAEAELQWQESIDAMTESFREHGRNINADTEAGRANIKTVLEAVRAAEQKREAAIELAGGEQASAEAVQDANAKFREQIEQLKRTLKQAGLTDEQIRTLLGSYEALANAHDIEKNITVTIRQRTIGGRLMNANELAREFSSGVGGRATGGPVSAGRTYVVGEKGPELVTFGANGYVHDASDSRRMMAGRPASGSVGRAASAAAAVQLVTAPAADSAVAALVNHLVRRGLIQLRAVNGHVVAAGARG